METDTKNIFLFGLAILFGWMAVILICASPHLFRNHFKKRLCCFDTQQARNEEKIKMAEARVQATLALAEKPSNFLYGQVVAMSHIHKQSPRHSALSDELRPLEEGTSGRFNVTV